MWKRARFRFQSQSHTCVHIKRGENSRTCDNRRGLWRWIWLVVVCPGAFIANNTPAFFSRGGSCIHMDGYTPVCENGVFVWLSLSLSMRCVVTKVWMVWGDDDDVVQLPAFASANRAKNECGQLEIHPVVACRRNSQGPHGPKDWITAPDDGPGLGPAAAVHFIQRAPQMDDDMNEWSSCDFPDAFLRPKFYAKKTNICAYLHTTFIQSK